MDDYLIFKSKIQYNPDEIENFENLELPDEYPEEE